MHLFALAVLASISCVTCLPLLDFSSRFKRSVNDLRNRALLEANEIADSKDAATPISSATITHTISTVYTKDEARRQHYKEMLTQCNDTETDDDPDSKCPGCEFSSDAFSDPTMLDSSDMSKVTLVSAMEGLCRSDEERDASLNMMLASLISGGFSDSVMDGIKQVVVLATSTNTEDYKTPTLFTYSVTAEFSS
ncbi:uncharacterized protein LOC129583323 [Paramacrobiotus metropolitanus]|uniref:uncharacterized protein LOC129583323 n=1 Tax=Paramacrobiotus metropolitanus TaxID=2943436 RepID=UPI00244656DE|nr:uncharacterized protein LOC129583323 [Paramacrobiotus metropolitanus]